MIIKLGLSSTPTKPIIMGFHNKVCVLMLDAYPAFDIGGPIFKHCSFSFFWEKFKDANHVILFPFFSMVMVWNSAFQKNSGYHWRFEPEFMVKKMELVPGSR